MQCGPPPSTGTQLTIVVTSPPLVLLEGNQADVQSSSIGMSVLQATARSTTSKLRLVSAVVVFDLRRGVDEAGDVSHTLYELLQRGQRMSCWLARPNKAPIPMYGPELQNARQATTETITYPVGSCNGDDAGNTTKGEDLMPDRWSSIACLASTGPWSVKRTSDAHRARTHPCLGHRNPATCATRPSRLVDRNSPPPQSARSRRRSR